MILIVMVSNICVYTYTHIYLPYIYTTCRYIHIPSMYHTTIHVCIYTHIFYLSLGNSHSIFTYFLKFLFSLTIYKIGGQLSVYHLADKQTQKGQVICPSLISLT